MKIYTKTGDKGKTGLFGGKRVDKDSLRIDCYGTVDELNAFIGRAIIDVADESVRQLLIGIQNELFRVGSDLATPGDYKNEKFPPLRIHEEYYQKLETAIDLYTDKLPPLSNFILPGGTKSAAGLHICRTVCRRAERLVAALEKEEEINHTILIFLNRLSDLFFTLARYENFAAGVDDVAWQKD